MAATDTATQLMQLRKPEFIRTAHQNRVGAGHINTSFDDGGAQQNIEALRHKVTHDFFQLTLWHLPMRHSDAGFGNQFLQALFAVLDGLDFVMQEIALAAALQFSQYRFADDAVVFGSHKSFDGQATLWCSGNYAQVAQTFQGHAQGARNGCGRQGQDVHLSPHGFDGFFVTHAETVFLINDQQPQIFELDGVADQLMGTHHDIDRASFQAHHGGFDLLWRAKTAHLGDLHGPFGKAVGQGLEMLLCQERGGRQDRHLFAAHHRDEGGA